MIDKEAIAILASDIFKKLRYTRCCEFDLPIVGKSFYRLYFFNDESEGEIRQKIESAYLLNI